MVSVDVKHHAYLTSTFAGVALLVPDPIPGLLALRVLEVTSLGFGLLSVLGVTCLYVTARHYDCRRIASQALFTFSSLAAGE